MARSAATNAGTPTSSAPKAGTQNEVETPFPTHTEGRAGVTPPSDSDGDGSTREDAAWNAIANAGIGESVFHVDLASIGAIGDVTVSDAGVSVTVTLPMPSDRIREEIATEIKSAAMTVPEIEAVAVEFRPRASDSGKHVDMLPDVKNVVAVASGKGGVGKSTVASNLAVALGDAGADVGLLDADVYGPNAPAMLGLDDRSADATAADEMVPRKAHGVRVMSMEFIADEDDPVIWRGPLVDEFLKQLAGDVQWGSLDYLVVDLPPGTGDVHLSLVQHLPVAGTVIVTTPQAVAVDDAARGLLGFARYGAPVLGVVENMAGFECPDCGEIHDIFGSDGAAELADEFGIPVLGSVPLDPTVGTLESNEDPEQPPGIDVPLVGRLQLPRTAAERTQRNALPPLVLREDGGAPKDALRETATRVAARLQEAATQLDDDATLHDITTTEPEDLDPTLGE
jgi:ATP-binding protein involved in chromosome partitioning